MDDKWTVNYYTDKAFMKTHGDYLGLCEYDHKKRYLTINLRGPKVSRDTIAHELMHAYLSYRDFSRTKAVTMEERICELIGNHHTQFFNNVYLIDHALAVYNE